MDGARGLGVGWKVEIGDHEKKLTRTLDILSDCM